MKQIVFAVALAVALQPFAVGAQAPASVAAPGVPVVGTFDRTSIVLAFYRSPQWAAILADRKYELSVAKNSNDSAKVKELEKWGGDRQELAMQQVMGKAPIANILEVLQPELKEISGRMKLASIVESPSPDPKAATVDVTSLLMDWLRASQETRKEAGDMHQQHPGAK
jgi:hypothetical protein